MNVDIVVPRPAFEPIRFQPSPRVHVTEFGVQWALERFRAQHRRTGRKLPPVAGGSGTLSAWAEQTVLNHLTGQDNASWANLSPTYLALCTTVPTASSTGTTIVEATYTGYARASLANTAWTAASGTAPASTPNSGTLTFAACTAGSSTIIGLAVCTALTLGNVCFWMSAASTVISTTQTPATVSAAAITASLT